MNLVVGNTYYTREGVEVDIVYKDPFDTVYPYQGKNNVFYNSCGRENIYKKSGMDLVSIKNTEKKIMSKEDFFRFVELESAELVKLMRAKNADYTAGGGPFANFEGAKEFGITPLQGLLLRLSDKFQRLKSFSKNGKLEVNDEGLEDAFRDIIGYSYLALGMIKDGK